jgi:PD-(D/E)XK nuclease superfamily protein
MGKKKTGSKIAGSNRSASRRVNPKTLPPHRRRCIIIKDAKHRGEWAELNFMTRVTERGFNASKPWGDSSRYDVAVELDGRFLRVQVKSTIARQDGGYVCAIKSSRCQYYTRHQVDFFAVYVIPEDVWYILPAEIIVVLRGHFFLNPRRPRHKYALYKEAWHLLKTGWHEKSPARRSPFQAIK